MKIRMVGGPYDNVMTEAFGHVVVALDPEMHMDKIMKWERDDPRLNEPVKTHTYQRVTVKVSGEDIYLHGAECCETFVHIDDKTKLHHG